MKKAILYGRVSTAEKKLEPKNLDLQIKKLKAYCKKKKIKVIEICVDEHSGGNFKREGFQFILAQLRSKKMKAHLLLVTEWDRFCPYIIRSSKMTKELHGLGIKPFAILEPKLSNLINGYAKIAITI